MALLRYQKDAYRARVLRATLHRLNDHPVGQERFSHSQDLSIKF